MTPPLLFALAGCLAVNPGADQILARDLAAAYPAMSAVAPETPVGFAPAPGVSRIFRVAELQRLAARFHLDPPPSSDLCFERPVHPLEPARLLAAMLLLLPAANIEILDFSHAPIPEGEPEFALAGLHQSPAGEIWNGFVRYAGNRRCPIWVKVKVRVAAARVVAAEDLKAGLPVSASQLRVETSDGFPGIVYAATLAEVEGRVLRRSVPAGSAIRPLWLDLAHDVTRGDKVKVEVRSGNARLEFEGEAQASGSAGQTIRVRNPESKKLFPAKIEGKGRVTVEGGL